MGLFDAVGRYFKRARARHAARRRFSPYADPALVEYVLSNPDTVTFELRQARVDFVLVLVRDDDPKRVAELFGQVGDAIKNSGGFLDGIMGSILFVTFGAVEKRPADEAVAQRLAVVTQLGQRLGRDIRILHGCVDALVGDMGCGGRLHYGAVPPHFGRMAHLLTSMQPGEIREWNDLSPHDGAAPPEQ